MDRAENDSNRMSGQDDEKSALDKTRKAYEIDIFRAWCKACGICTAFCPVGCLGRDEAGEPIVEHADRCTGCGWCELHCPDFAISVRPRKTARNHEQD
jgi:2-oxoglutarate ferredoxin oxidoreductase subunit delta